MKYQPTPGFVSNDDIQTPMELCNLLVDHLEKYFYGTCLEPCRGEGNFSLYLNRAFSTEVDYCEIKEGKDFFDYSGKVDWIVTNPPFSQCKAFMDKSFQVADNVVLLITLNHVLGLKARWRLLDKYQFGVREIMLLNTPPKPWPQAGFQLGAVWWQRGYDGEIILKDLRGDNQ